MRLKEKVAIITGDASGMGQGEAIRFAKEGAKVVVADLNFEGAQAVAEEIKAFGGNYENFHIGYKIKIILEIVIVNHSFF